MRAENRRETAMKNDFNNRHNYLIMSKEDYYGRI